MPDNMDRVSVVAQVASAAAAVAYPLGKLVSGYLDRRKERAARQYAAPAAAVEARLIERCIWLEERLANLERQLRRAA